MKGQKVDQTSLKKESVSHLISRTEEGYLIGMRDISLTFRRDQKYTPVISPMVPIPAQVIAAVDPEKERFD